MAISEACKFELEENVDKACEEHGISKKEAFEALETFYNRIGVRITFGTIERKYYRAKEAKNKLTNVSFDKPARQHTKPEVKTGLKNVAKAIVTGQVSNEDMKIIDKAVAETIKTGRAPKTVGASTEVAVGGRIKKKGGDPKPKPADNFYRLNNHMKIAIDGLTVWADGAMKPTTRDEADYAKAILG